MLTSMLPDMLEKSYFLEDRVFSLVKSVDDMQGICKRLKVTYADTNAYKNSELSNFKRFLKAKKSS